CAGPWRGSLRGKFPPRDPPAQSSYALREAQTKALKLDQVGMAVTIDIGLADDIHPKNKLNTPFPLFYHDKDHRTISFVRFNFLKRELAVKGKFNRYL
ncbi:hypothetical protein, partial [Hominenteromicrobium sp.]|uniref:hypothetical protein n=1 Tax=Hominenteromicrobium sp. TaxID=3073581 RepID=UPI003AB86940